MDTFDTILFTLLGIAITLMSFLFLVDSETFSALESLFLMGCGLVCFFCPMIYHTFKLGDE